MSKKAYLIDRDGVIVYAKDGQPVSGAHDWINRLSKTGQPFLIATNHTTSSPEEGAEDLRKMEFPIKDEQMHTPLSILFDHFERKSPGKIFVRGTPELIRFLQSKQLDLRNGPDVNTVLLGFDQTMSYQALATAISAVLDYRASIIALHENRIYRDASGNVEPGLGAWVRALEYATNNQAIIVGKPSHYYYLSGMKKMGSQPENTVMISDDPLGDLVGAKKAGLKTIFVTSGKYPDATVLSQLSSTLQPDEIMDSIADVDIES